MKQIEVIRLGLRFVRGYRKRTFILCSNAALVALLVTYLTSLSLGARKMIYDQILPQFPPTRIVARPRSVAFFFMKLTDRSNSITPETIDTIRKIPGVANVFPELPLTFPCCISASFAGSEFISDSAVIGIEKAQVAKTISHPDLFHYDPSAKIVPCVLSTAFLEMYNAGIATGVGLPKVTPEAALGREFDLYLGMSQFLQTNPKKLRHVRCKIVGLSPSVSVVGVSVPIGYAREWMKWYTGGRAKENYSRVTIIAQDPLSVDKIVATLKKMKLSVRTNKRLAASLTLTARIFSGALALIAAAILLIGATALSNGIAASIAEQHGYYALLCALGASPRSILAIVGWQGLLIALMGAAIGSTAAAGLIHLSTTIVNRGTILPLPFSARALFFNPPVVAVSVFVIGCAIGIISSILPAFALAHETPARALQGK